MYPEMLKYRVNLTETEKVIALPLWLKERRRVGIYPFGRGLVLILPVGREGLGHHSSCQQHLPSHFAKDTPLCGFRDMDTQR